MEIKSGQNLMQMLGSTEAKGPEQGANGAFESIFNSKFDKISENVVPIKQISSSTLEITIEARVSECFHCDNNKLGEAMGKASVSADSAHKMVDIVASIRLLEQVITLDTMSPSQENSLLTDGEILTDQTLTTIDEQSVENIDSPLAAGLVVASEGDLPLVAVKPEGIAEAELSETVVPETTPKSKKAKSSVLSEEHALRKLIKKDAVSPDEKDAIVAQAINEVALLRQALIDLIRKTFSVDGETADSIKGDCTDNLCGDSLLKVSFTDATVAVKAIVNDNSVVQQKSLYQLDIFFTQTAGVKFTDNQNSLKESLHQISEFMDLGLKETQAKVGLDSAILSKIEPAKIPLNIQDFDLPVANKSNSASSQESIAEAGLSSFAPVEDMEDGALLVSKKDLSKIQVSKVKVSAVHKSVGALQLNSVMKELHIKATISGLHIKSAVQNVVIETPKVIGGLNEPVPTSGLVLDSEAELPDAVTSEDGLSTGAKKIIAEKILFDDELKNSLPVKTPKDKSGVSEVKQGEAIKKPIETNIVLDDKKTVLLDEHQKIENKRDSTPSHEVKLTTKVKELLVTGDGSVTTVIAKDTEIEKSLITQRKSFKEMITSANKASVVEMQHSGLSDKSPQIAPAGRLKEHLGQAIVSVEQDGFKDDATKLENKEMLIKAVDMSLSTADISLAELEGNTDSAEIHMAENEKGQFDAVLHDKKSIVATEVNRQEILERINQVAVVQKLMKKVQVQKLLSEGVVQLRIDPPELGQLLLKMSVKNHEVVLQITAENQQAKELILNQKHLFVQNMKEAGLEVKSLEVQVGKESAHDFSRESGQQAQQQRFRQPQQAPKFFEKEIARDRDLVDATQESSGNSHLNMIA